MRDRRRAARIVAAVAATMLATPALAASAHAAPATPALYQAPTSWVPVTTTPEPGHATSEVTCDPTDGSSTRTNMCMLPFPSDYWTKPDATSATGRRVDMPVTVMPRNAEGQPIDPTPYDEGDGFSPGSQILVDVPGMTSNADLALSDLPPVTDIGSYANLNSGVVLLDPLTGERVPVWAEVDQYASGNDPTGTPYEHLLMIHPASNLQDGHRYIVALRHLVLDNGQPAPSPAGFQAYVNGSATDNRVAHMQDLFNTLAKVGITKDTLNLAWDFTTASTANLTGRLTHIRDDAFSQLGQSNLTTGKVIGSAPTFSITSTTNYTSATNGNVGRMVEGTVSVPCYLAPNCATATECAQSTITDYCSTPSEFAINPASPDVPPSQTAGQVYTAQFECIIPQAAFSNPTLMLRPSLYGHGLFGTMDEVTAGNVEAMAQGHGMLECATPWYGMAAGDIPNALAALGNLSLFPSLVDKVEQGELAFTYLARLMIHPQGLCTSAAFQRTDGSCMIDRTTAYYDGNSQGGIYGGTVCAIIPDATRCVLGVPGMNYVMLLPRSSDYVRQFPITSTNPGSINPTNPSNPVAYSDAFDNAYPDQSQRILVMDLIQLLWDRADPDAYASHMTTDPLENTPVHHVLMQVAFGDHQVANITAETEARTIGAELLTPALEPGRSLDVVPYWGIPHIPTVPYDGSGIVIFDSGPLRNNNTQGTNPPPPADVPNWPGQDPHEGPRGTTCGQQQKSDFLKPNGVVTDPCPGPKFDQGYTGAVSAGQLPEVGAPALLLAAGCAVAAAIGLRRRRAYARG